MIKYIALFLICLIAPSFKAENEIDWAGFRFSENGIKKKENFGKIPEPDEWVKNVNKFRRNFKGPAKPTVLVLVNSIHDDCEAHFRFPAPDGFKETKYIKYNKKDTFEKILTKFDEKDFNVWLQIEPGENDLIELAKITFKHYGHHKCVKGFGLDLEWWHRKADKHGQALDDRTAKKVVEYVRSINKDYTVFAKHWRVNFMPPTYRDGMIFVDDSQGLKSTSNMQKTFQKWAKAFPDNPVMFQIGYKADKPLWKSSPIKFANDVIKAVSKYNKHVGIIWVDFTLKEALRKM